MCFFIYTYASFVSMCFLMFTCDFLCFYVLSYISLCFSYVSMCFLMFTSAFLRFHVLPYVSMGFLALCMYNVHASGHLNNRSILFASLNFYLFLNVFMRFSVLFGSFVYFLVLYCASFSNIDLFVLACTSANP